MKESMPPIEIFEKKNNLYFTLCWAIIMAVYAVWVFVRPYRLPSPMILFPILYSLQQNESLNRWGLKKWIFILMIFLLFFTLIFIGQNETTPDKSVAFMKYGATLIFNAMILVISVILIVISFLTLFKNKPILIIDPVGIKLNAAFVDFTTEIKWIDVKDVCQSVKPKNGVIELDFNYPQFLSEKINKEKSLIKRWAIGRMLGTNGSKLCIQTKRLNVPYETLLPTIQDCVKRNEASC